MNDYQNFIYLGHYARWLPELGRREVWPETVKRYFDFMESVSPEMKKFLKKERPELESAVLNLEVVPSMRCLMTAGPALSRNHIAAYNCAYLSVADPRAFDETLLILMHGTGVGFSVERDEISQMPKLPEEFEKTDTVIVVADTKEGWQAGLKELVNLLYAGRIPTWDLSKIRPAGERLKTFGGRASGPGPLDQLFHFFVDTFINAEGDRLDSLECHDLMCKIAEVVVAGGVRRSALISLSNLQDDRIRDAKMGAWHDFNPQRALANNSVVYTQKPNIGTFMREWISLYDSKSGERGMFYRGAAEEQVAKYGKRETGHKWGTNPCSEIILRPKQFCNLTEVIARADDTKADLSRKIKLAAKLGTMQACLTNFKGLTKRWTINTEEERLLGVSITGIMDNQLLARSKNGLKEELRIAAEVTNKAAAALLKISPATAITCVKPSGTVSQLTDTASGIHPRHSRFYLRTVRSDKKDPLTQFLIDQGVPYEDCIGSEETQVVFSFPQEAPEGALTREGLTALEHLDIWQGFARDFCEHKPSVTISVHEHEWLEVGEYVYRHFNSMTGVSFLPYSEHSYQQAPYQKLTAREHKRLTKLMPTEIEWGLLRDYEQEDNTTSSQEFACVGGLCEV